eukprot:m.57643 g.57643  ORF g.57643 m.57643 type:complete len:1929 (-) comp7833_c0_seq1:1783-7569(-)
MSVFKCVALLAMLVVLILHNARLSLGQTCAHSVDSNDPCNHDCCKTNLFDNACVVDPMADHGYRCTCNEPHASLYNNTECSCAHPEICSGNGISTDCSTCFCKPNSKEVCVKGGANCKEQTLGDGSTLYSYSTGCSACQCKDVDCGDPETTLASPIVAGYCACDKQEYICQNYRQCILLGLAYNRRKYGFQAGCEDCVCSKVEPMCTSPNATSLEKLSPLLTLEGNLNCDSSIQEHVYISSFEWTKGNNLKAYVYLFVTENGITSRGQYEVEAVSPSNDTGCVYFDELGGFIETPNVPGFYSPPTLAMQLIHAPGTSQLQFVGVATECQSSSVVLSEIALCDYDLEYRLVYGACHPLLVCEPGMYVSKEKTFSSDRVCKNCRLDTFSDMKNAPTCQSLRNCPSGTYVSFNGNSTLNRQCNNCPENTYSDEANSNDCNQYTTCTSGIAEFIAPSPTSDRVCSNCDGIHTYQDEKGQVKCKVVHDCMAGSYETKPPSFTSDRVCTNCTIGFYQPYPNKQSCVAATTCNAGSFVYKEHTSISDRVCHDCNGVTEYQSYKNQGSCLKPRTCPKGEEEDSPPTSSSDRVCIACSLGETFKPIEGQSIECLNTTTCGVGMQTKINPTLSTDRICNVCQQNEFKDHIGNDPCTAATLCLAGEYIFQTYTSSSDAICKDCPQGTFSSSHSKTSCSTFSKCSAEEYELTSPTPSSDRRCADLKICASNEWEFSAPTTTSNRVCMPCTTCPSTHEKLQECTATQDTQCKQCLSCSFGNYLVERCNNDFDGKCGPCDECDFTTQFEAQSCKFSLNRICQNFTICGSDEYETKAPTTISDRKCSPISMCTYLQYESMAATVTSDRTCKSLSPPCSPGFEQSNPPTTTSDRVCTVCEKGYIDQDSMPNSPCERCEAGVFVPSMSAGECADFKCEKGKIDEDLDPSTPCVLCVNGYQDERGGTKCKPWTNCNPGEHVVIGSRTVLNDTKCASCEKDISFSIDGTVCLPVNTCALGTYEAVVPTLSSNRVCKTCPINTYSSDVGNNCAPVTVCSAGEEEVMAPTSSSDRVCQPCVFGETYQTMANASSPCKQTTICSAGMEQKTPPSLTSDRVCRSCVLGETWTDTVSNDKCLFVSYCPVGKEQLHPPTLTTDRQCINCQTGVTFKDTIGQTACLNVSTCGEGYITAVRPTTSSDRVCVSCPMGFFKDNADSNGACVPQSPPCEMNEFESQLPTISTDRKCSTISHCDNSTYVSVNATLTSDVQCSQCRMCTEGHVRVKECSYYSNTECEGCKLCTEGFFEAKQCTLLGHTVCQSCLQCDLTSHYVFEPCTRFHDTLCALRTNCTEMEYNAIEAGSTEDNKCLPITDCMYHKQYEFAPPTSSSNRICNTISVCDAGTELVSNYTRTSDVMCSPCQPGFSDHDGNPLTPCIPCMVGTYSNPDNYGHCETCTPGSVDGDTMPTTPCVTCAIGESYQDAFGKVSCKPTRTCGEGYEETTLATLSSDRVCTVCKAGFFKDTTGQTLCEMQSICPIGEGLILLGTIADDNVCRSCPGGKFKSEKGLYPCSTATECDLGQQEIASWTASSDRICEACPSGTFKASRGSVEQCKPWKLCIVGQEYQFAEPTLSSDRACLPLTTCREDEFEDLEPTPTSDRVCAELNALYALKLFLNTSYQDSAVTVAERSAIQVKLKFALVDELKIVRVFVGVVFEENDVVVEGAIVATVSTRSSSVHDALKGKEFFISIDEQDGRRRRDGANSTTSNSTTKVVRVVLYTEDEARAAALAIYNNVLNTGGYAAAVEAARMAYAQNGGMIAFSRAWDTIAPSSAPALANDKNAQLTNTLILAGSVFLFAISVMVFGITTHRLKKGGYFISNKAEYPGDSQEFTNPTFDPSLLSTASAQYLDVSGVSHNLLNESPTKISHDGPDNDDDDDGEDTTIKNPVDE